MSRMQFAVVADYRGMSMEDLADWRAKMFEQGAEIIVAKNTLLRIAARNTGSDAMEPLLKGPTSVMFVYDNVAVVAKAFNAYARDHDKIKVRGGLLGRSMVKTEDLAEVEKMPKKEAVIAQILGGLVLPLSGVVNAINAPVANLVGIIDAPARDVVGILSAVSNDVVGVLQARIMQLQAAEAEG
ncbi:MAG: 50S ribosomal protein L10 [Chloroflexaceae bacterium]|nr:50S ribosomal protein L10 [Chloroflexaceae bacterium]